MSAHPNVGSTPVQAVDFVAPAFAPADVADSVRRGQHEQAALRRDAGYEAGLAQGRDEVESAIADHRASADRLARASEALEAAAADLARRDQLALTGVEDEIVAMAVELAEQIVGRELEVTPEPVLDAMARALRLAPERDTPVVRVHPDDESTARDAARADLVRWRHDISIVADDRVERGGCVVDVGRCRVDAQISSAVERMRSSL
ncbi:FliH/SctL family protein [Ilumatobacter sp.]|uniref:FliH/SctL family protein n=1 Tax=Ilumatobacter sp. TaxID=1967498 RepID=UPI003B51E177